MNPRPAKPEVHHPEPKPEQKPVDPAPEQGQDNNRHGRTPDTEPPKEKRVDDL